MKKRLYRQGDVLLRPVQIPRKAKRAKHRPLALGEKSGHAHVIEASPLVGVQDGDIEFYEADGKLFIRLKSEAVLAHRDGNGTGELTTDHAPIDVAPGEYEVVQQREATDNDEYRPVYD